MLRKKQLKETIESFPDEFTFDEHLDRIILFDKIEKGNRQSENGETISEEQLEIEMEKFAKSLN